MSGGSTWTTVAVAAITVGYALLWVACSGGRSSSVRRWARPSGGSITCGWRRVFVLAVVFGSYALAAAAVTIGLREGGGAAPSALRAASHHHVGQPGRTRFEGRPGPRHAQHGDRGRWELRAGPLQRVTLRLSGKEQNQLLHAGVVPDEHQRPDLRGDLPYDTEQLAGARPVDARLVDHRHSDVEPGRDEVPRLAGAAGGGTHDQVGNAARLAQPAADGRCVTAAARGKWPLGIGHVRRPGGLGVPQDGQAPAFARRHGVARC